jgi:ssDNA-binding replication factor A large subunit
MHLKVESNEIVVERKRFDGSIFKVAECLVGDSHGSARFRATNGTFSYTEQIDFFKVGSVVTIRNAHAKVVEAKMRLEVDKWGKIEESQTPVPTVNLKNNLSEVEYELVTVKKH